MSYAGPLLPLTAAKPVPDVIAERVITWDFAANTDSTAQGTTVIESYLLTNNSIMDISFTAIYPVATDFSSLGKTAPKVTMNNRHVDAALRAGEYTGSFQGVWTDGYLDNSKLLNLQPPSDWTDYEALLADGSYQKKRSPIRSL